MNDKDVQRAHRLWLLLGKLVKYGITALTVLCTVHCGLLRIGYDSLGLYVMFCSFLFVCGLCLSQLFNLCWVHRLCVFYTYMTVLCVSFQKHDMFALLGIDLDMARTIMYAFGLMISMLVLWKVQEKNC